MLLFGVFQGRSLLKRSDLDRPNITGRIKIFLKAPQTQGRSTD